MIGRTHWKGAALAAVMATAAFAGEGPPKFLFEGCGQVQPGPQGCLAFGTGEETFIVNHAETIVSLDGLFLGDQVFVSGSVVFTPDICFPVSGTAISIFDIQPCTEGDASLDGSVGFADLLEVLSNWGACPPGQFCAADLDQSGEVNFDDLLIVLANWSSTTG